MKKISLKIFIIIVLLISVFTLPLYYPTGITIYFRLFLLIAILIESLKLFKIIFIDKKINNIITNSATVLFSIFVLFILLEAIFMFIPRSHSADVTLASKLWFAKYWKPINSLGFRDNEPDNKNPVILFVGDSYTAGYGLKSVDDRFPNIIGKELNKKEKKYSIVNTGRPNMDSRDEYNAMKDFLYMTRIKPEKIILQYCGNDIDGIALNNGLTFSGFHPDSYTDKFIILIGSGSYLLNYIYWLFPREYLGESYAAFVCKAYNNADILAKHEADLKLFVDYARGNSIQLMVVVFPYLDHIEMSDSIYVNNIVNFFKANKINVINVSPLVKDIPVRERIININDAHASKKVNRIIAQEILNKLE
jgi:hypothetical protein